MIIKGYFYSILYALICLGLAFGLYRFGVEKKITRKVVHILVGFEWIILYKSMGPSVHFLAVCLLFTLLLLVSYRKNLMPMISSDADNAPGTVYYGVAMSIMAVICLFVPEMVIPFGIGVFCTSLGDGLAGLMGQLMSFPKNIKVYENKTLFGTLYNLVASVAIVWWFNTEFALGLSAIHFVSIALFSVVLELFTGRGLDNITITLGVSFLSFALIYLPGTENYLIPIILTPLIIALAHKKKALTVSGIVAAVVVDIIISICLGNTGFVILLTFFGVGIVVDKIKKKYKKTEQNENDLIEKRGDQRDHIQVFSNSVVGVCCAILFLFTSDELFLIAYCASIAEALADTVASGIGVIKGRAYDVFRMKPCEAGMSGGMSVWGTVASFAGGLVIGIVGFALGALDLWQMIIVTLSAFLGALFDSMLGSLIQVKYRCPKCGKITEREEHCSVSTEKYRGIKFINNDIVNLFGTLFAAIISAAIYNI